MTAQTNKLQVNVEDEDTNPKTLGEELEESLDDAETKLKSLTIQETEGWQVLAFNLDRLQLRFIMFFHILMKY